MDTNFTEAELGNVSRIAGTHGHCSELWLLLFWWREARLDGLEALAHFLEQALELFEAPVGRVFFVRASFGEFLALFATGMSPGLSFRRLLQTRDLPFDHGGHDDAEIVRFQERFERRNGGGVAATAKRKNASHANGVTPLREIGSDLRGDFLVVLLEASQTVNRRGARIDGLSKLGPFEKERNSSIIAERAEGAK